MSAWVQAKRLVWILPHWRRDRLYPTGYLQGAERNNMNKTKIYVAGPSAHIEKCRSYMRALTEAGFEITFDWTHSFAARPETEAEARVYDATQVEKDIDAILRADLVVALLGPSTGICVEIGVALVIGMPVLAVGQIKDAPAGLAFWLTHPLVTVIGEKRPHQLVDIMHRPGT